MKKRNKNKERNKEIRETIGCALLIIGVVYFIVIKITPSTLSRNSNLLLSNVEID